MKSTTYYETNRDRLFAQYERIDPLQVHRVWFEKHLDKSKPGLACDIGAGSGRDARWLANQGWQVIAVEPSKLSDKAEQHDRVEWLKDSLPGLTKLRGLGHRFDLILLSGVWMHIATSHRRRAFRILTELLKPSGVLIIGYRNAVDESEAEEKGFFPIQGGELIKLAQDRAVTHQDQYGQSDFSRDGIEWNWHVLSMPDDGTGNLPLLRHIIVNDNKSATYKLGLLLTLVRLAETAPGIVINETDDYVEIPFGSVGLYWIKLYLPLITHHKMRQGPGTKGYGFAKRPFYHLNEICSPFDLCLGRSFDVERASVIQQAINDACRNIQLMPAHFITYPGTTKEVFNSDFKAVRGRRRSQVLSKEYLSQFGSFRIPRQIWQTFSHFACWLEPAITREWQQLHRNWNNHVDKQGKSTEEIFRIDEGKRDTALVRRRAIEVQHRPEYQLRCIWSNENIRKSLAIDHCFPWARWPNNDLWNLMPTKSRVNSDKSDKLPSLERLAEARQRMIDWWDIAWLETDYREQFLMEASYALPGIELESPSLHQIYQATRHQQIRLANDQQIPEWPALGDSVRD